jgi:hypothetical protein
MSPEAYTEDGEPKGARIVVLVVAEGPVFPHFKHRL